MRFIGNKQKLLEFILSKIREHKIGRGILIDIFSGTTNVAKFFKRLDYPVISNDLLCFSYIFQRAYIQNNRQPLFRGLKKIVNQSSLSSVIECLNSLKGVEGFMYNNFTKGGTSNKEYSRNYLSEENARKIDAIRDKIEQWKIKKIVTEEEYFILLTSLIEAVPYVSNIAGTYGAFLKIDDPRKYKPLTLKNPEIIINKNKNFAFNEDGNELIKKIKGDVLYIDPPYNSRQYAPNYHLLEHIAIWDKKVMDNKTGLRDYNKQKSLYCAKNKVYHVTLDLIEKAINKAQVKHILFSYNNEGLLEDYQIKEIFDKFGKVYFYKKSYPRFTHRNNHRKNTEEYLFYLSVQ